jgi:hypothetical protein
VSGRGVVRLIRFVFDGRLALVRRLTAFVRPARETGTGVPWPPPVIGRRLAARRFLRGGEVHADPIRLGG